MNQFSPRQRHAPALLYFPHTHVFHRIVLTSITSLICYTTTMHRARTPAYQFFSFNVVRAVIIKINTNGITGKQAV